MWKLLTLAAALALTSGIGGCSIDGGGGSLLPNSYIRPLETNLTARITFTGESNDPELSGYQIYQSTGPWTPTSRRNMLILSGPSGWADIPPGGSYNTVTKSVADADRTMLFTARQPVYFTGVLGNGNTYTCSVGVTFAPAPDRAYTVKFIGHNYNCTATVVDDETGETPPTLQLYAPEYR